MKTSPAKVGLILHNLSLFLPPEHLKLPISSVYSVAGYCFPGMPNLFHLISLSYHFHFHPAYPPVGKNLVACCTKEGLYQVICVKMEGQHNGGVLLEITFFNYAIMVLTILSHIENESIIFSAEYKRLCSKSKMLKKQFQRLKASKQPQQGLIHFM